MKFLLSSYHWSLADRCAVRKDWVQAEKHISKAINLSGFFKSPKKTPILMMVLAAVIYYRIGKFDETYEIIATANTGFAFPQKGLNQDEKSHILHFLAQLLEFMAGEDSHKSERYLRLANEILPGYVYPNEGLVRTEIKCSFPLVL